jgi:hypothetical protein
VRPELGAGLDHAVLMGTSVIEVVRELLAHRPVIRPRVLRDS